MPSSSNFKPTFDHNIHEWIDHQNIHNDLKWQIKYLFRQVQVIDAVNLPLERGRSRLLKYTHRTCTAKRDRSFQTWWHCLAINWLYIPGVKLIMTHQNVAQRLFKLVQHWWITLVTRRTVPPPVFYAPDVGRIFVRATMLQMQERTDIQLTVAHFSDK